MAYWPYPPGELARHFEDLMNRMLQKEKPTMKLEDAIVLARWGTQRKNGVETRARVTLRNEALRVCKARAEELMEAADKKAEAERVLVDIWLEHTLLMGSTATVVRKFSDGTETRSQENADYGRQLVHTFEQGKKAHAWETSRPCVPG